MSTETMLGFYLPGGDTSDGKETVQSSKSGFGYGFREYPDLERTPTLPGSYAAGKPSGVDYYPGTKVPMTDEAAIVLAYFHDVPEQNAPDQLGS